MVTIMHHRYKVYVVHIYLLSVFHFVQFLFAYPYRSCVYISIYATCCGIDVVLITLTFVVLMFLMLLCSYSYIVLYKYYNHTFAVVADNQTC